MVYFMHQIVSEGLHDVKGYLPREGRTGVNGAVFVVVVTLMAQAIAIGVVLKRNHGRQFKIGSPLQHKYQATVALVGSAMLAGLMVALLHDFTGVQLIAIIATATWLFWFAP